MKYLSRFVKVTSTRLPGALVIELLFLLFLVCESCSQIKVSLLMKQGRVDADNFIEQVEYQTVSNVIILNAQVNGLAGRFLFDTGAPCVLSPEFARRAGIDIVARQRATDSQQSSQEIGFGKIEQFQIGAISFREIGAAIADLNTSTDMRCLKLDGVIGANLARLAAWQIDFASHTLTIRDQTFPGEYDISIPFKTNYYGTPEISLRVGAITVDGLTVDTGSNGEITLPKILLKEFGGRSGVNYREFGFGSSGIFGQGRVDTTYIQNNTVSLENLNTSTIVRFYNTDEKLIGNAFWKRYHLTIDWKSKALYLRDIQLEDDEIVLPPFRVGYHDNKFIIASVITGRLPDSLGFHPGAVIVRWKNINTSKLTEEEYCQLRISPWEIKPEDINIQKH